MNVLSRIISRNHKILIITKFININLKLIHKIIVINKFIKFIDIIIGHGLILTKKKWKIFFHYNLNLIVISLIH